MHCGAFSGTSRVNGLWRRQRSHYLSYAFDKYAAKTGNIVTAEEHNIIGGLGSAVAEILAENGGARLARVGVEDVFGTSAPAGVLIDYYGLNAAGIAARVRRLLGK